MSKKYCKMQHYTLDKHHLITIVYLEPIQIKNGMLNDFKYQLVYVFVNCITV